MKFQEIEFDERIKKAIEDLGFIKTTEAQSKCMAYINENKDLMVQSKTGSGKTLIFLLAIAISEVKKEGSKSLIIAPTRELALQISEEANKVFKYFSNIKIGCFYGGVGYDKQKKDLDSNIVIGTPGRIIDFEKSKSLDFSLFDNIIIDEADRLFDMGFYADIDYLFSKTKKDKRVLLFSATLSTKVRNIAWSYLKEPVEIEVTPEEVVVNKIDQRLYHVANEDKFKTLLYLLEKEKEEYFLIFVNTKFESERLSKKLKDNGYLSQSLSGNLNQKARLKVLNNMKNKKINILVATDVAARGLQIDDLPIVINYDLPENYENYVHRVGRTARAGKKGVAISLACMHYVYSLMDIEEYIGMKIPVFWVDEKDLASIKDKSHFYKENNEKKPFKKNNIKQKKFNKDFKSFDNSINKHEQRSRAISLDDKIKIYSKEFDLKLKKKKRKQKQDKQEKQKLTFFEKIKRFFRS